MYKVTGPYSQAPYSTGMTSHLSSCRLAAYTPLTTPCCSRSVCLSSHEAPGTGSDHVDTPPLAATVRKRALLVVNLSGGCREQLTHVVRIHKSNVKAVVDACTMSCRSSTTITKPVSMTHDAYYNVRYIAMMTLFTDSATGSLTVSHTDIDTKNTVVLRITVS